MRKNHFEAFYQASNHLLNIGVPHWIDFGTLLGATRNGRIIPGDLDVDIDFWGEDLHRILDQSAFFLKKLGLVVLFNPAVGVVRILPEHKALDLRSDWAAHRSCINNGVLYMDLYPCSKKEKTVLHAVPGFEFRSLFLENIEFVEFEGFSFPAPRNKVPLLINRYGRNWRIPIPIEQYQPIQNELKVPFPAEIKCYVHGLFDSPMEEYEDSLKRLKSVFDQIIVGLVPDKDASVELKQALSRRSRIEKLRACTSVNEVLPKGPTQLTRAFLDLHGCSFFTLLEPHLRQQKEVFQELLADDIFFECPK